MVIRALDHVSNCDTAESGAIINRILKAHLSDGMHTQLSFSGVFDAPSSFINAAIVALLNDYDEVYIKTHLTIIDATKQIADMIRRCLANGIRRQRAG